MNLDPKHEELFIKIIMIGSFFSLVFLTIYYSN